MSQRQIWLPSDVFPPRCGGAGWSAHALATALQAHGEQVTAFVPRGSQATHTTTIGQIRTVEIGVPTVPVRMLQGPLRVGAMQRAMHQYRGSVGTDTLIIHAQHIVSAKAAMALRDRHTRMVITVRDHWPWDMRATGMQMHGDQRTWAGMNATLTARQASLTQRLLTGAYLHEMRLRSRLLVEADAVIAVSTHMAERIAQYAPSTRVYAIPNMVDNAQIASVLAQPPTTITLPERFALFVGKLEPNKGAELLPELIERIRPPALVVAGNGALQAQITQAAARAEVPCLALDWVDHDDVLRLMARCEALWFPSSWDEPLSRTLLEGLACGAPIVAMPTGGTPEIIQDGTSGLLAHDLTQFVHAAQRLHHESMLRAALARGAQERALTHFSPAAVIRAVQALYDEIGGQR